MPWRQPELDALPAANEEPEQQSKRLRFPPAPSLPRTLHRVWPQGSGPGLRRAARTSPHERRALGTEPECPRRRQGRGSPGSVDVPGRRWLVSPKRAVLSVLTSLTGGACPSSPDVTARTCEEQVATGAQNRRLLSCPLAAATGSRSDSCPFPAPVVRGPRQGCRPACHRESRRPHVTNETPVLTSGHASREHGDRSDSRGTS